MTYYPIIGLEVHLELNTESKAFCGCSTEFGNAPNSQTCPVCLGLPGSLPVLNKQALLLALKAGIALGCAVSDFTKFDRKNYFYPDLPKNFQISQYDKPLSSKGFLDVEIEKNIKRVGITRVHLEEDTGKLIHKEGSSHSLIDFNRSGRPLLEIVSEPDINSPFEAYEYLSQLKAILQYLDVSDCDMEKGSLRCDANISISDDPEKLGTKTEIKNMNSFKAVKAALEYEADRQIKLLDEGVKIKQETRLWDDNKASTVSMRSKEEAHDYRYFPEPDLVPFMFDENQIKEVKDSLPQLPQERKKRLVAEYGLSEYDASVLTQDKLLADYFEECAKIYDAECSGFASDTSACRSDSSKSSNIRHKPKNIANWLLGGRLGIPEKNLVQLLKLIDDGAISGKIAKEVLLDMIRTGKAAEDIVKENDMKQISDDKMLTEAAEKALKENPKAVSDFKSGKNEALVFLVGQLMKATKGKANPGMANKILRDLLNA